MTLPPRRLTPVERFIAEVLERSHALYGLQIVEESGGRVKRGTVYVTLGRMEDKGLVAGGAGPPERRAARYYQLTHLGLTILGVERSLDKKLVKAR